MPVRIRSSIAANSGPRWLIIWRAPASRTDGGSPVGPGMRRLGSKRSTGTSPGALAVTGGAVGRRSSRRGPHLCCHRLTRSCPGARFVMSLSRPRLGTPVRPLSGRVVSSGDGPGPHRRSLPVARPTRERGDGDRLACAGRVDARDRRRQATRTRTSSPIRRPGPGWNAKRPPCARWTTRRSSGRASWSRTPTRRRWSWTSSRAGRSTNASPVARCRRAKPSRSPASSRTRSPSRTTTGSSIAISSPATSWSTMTERST